MGRPLSRKAGTSLWKGEAVRTHSSCDADLGVLDDDLGGEVDWRAHGGCTYRALPPWVRRRLVTAIATGRPGNSHGVRL
jgi:hypothetical protein